MDMQQLQKLQNGSDVRGVALPGVAGEPVNLTPAHASVIAKAFARFLATRENKPVASLRIGVGHDSRLSAEALKEGVIGGLSALGVQVFDCGLTSTPSMFMSTVFPEFAYDGAVMLTASHLPFNRNGLKFFHRDGGLESSDIKGILCAAAGEEERTVPGAAQRAALLPAYAAFLRDCIRQAVGGEHPLEGLHIVVDAGNGAGGFFPAEVLEPLGADISGSQFLEPDGSFPNHIPNPEDHAAMLSICDCVSRNGADLGIIFDTDVDRASAVDRFGREINQNAIVALMAAIVSREHPGTAVVTDSVTSDKLTAFLEEELHMRHHRFKRGYKNVINEGIRLNAAGEPCYLAIETSGHCALKENYFLDDGAYMAVKIVSAAARMRREGKTIDALIEKLGAPLERLEQIIPSTSGDFGPYGDRILAEYERYAEAEPLFHVVPRSYEGVRVSFDDEGARGFALLRKSLHDPRLMLNIEADNPGGAAEIKRRLYAFLARYDELILK